MPPGSLINTLEERWYRHIVEQTTQHAIFAIDPKGRIATWNRGAEQLFCYSPDEIVGQHFSILFTADYVRAGVPESELQSAAAAGQHVGVPHWAQRKDGSRVYVSGLTIALHEAGQLQGYFKFVDDRSAEQRVREELREVALLYQHAQESHRAKDEFLATVSHELRTPLQAILGWSRLLRMGKLDPSAAAKAQEIIERSARSQAKLIDDLLDVSRIIAGKLAVERKPIDLLAVVAGAADAARPSAATKGLKLIVQLEPAACLIDGDPVRLQQVFGNLLSNSIKFTPAGGSITVKLRHCPDHAEVLVSDTGTGITPEFLPHVFERFKQSEAGEAKANKGLGLGLAIVRHLVELHGGRVTVYSAGKGKGATFTVRLPLRKDAQLQPPSEAN